MITAAEAVKLVKNSVENVDRYIALIDPIITKLATEGKRSYDCYVDGLWTSMNDYEYAFVSATDIQILVTKRLKESGYIVSLGKSGESYVPRGLSDDDGNGPSHVNVCLIIKW